LVDCLQVEFWPRTTGALAVALRNLAQVTAIYTILASPSDPNFYDDNEFKAALKKLLIEQRPVLVLDLHASHPSHPYDVDFGTMQARSLLGRPDLLDRLAASLREQGLQNVSQDFFSAAVNATVTKFVVAAGVPAVQCEINSTWLLPAAENGQPPNEWTNSLQYHRFAELLQGLMLFIRQVDARDGPAAKM